MDTSPSSGPQAGLGYQLHLSVCASAAVGAIAFGVPPPLAAQDIEPRSYSNAPVGVNFLISGYTCSRDGVAFDSALPITVRS